MTNTKDLVDIDQLGAEVVIYDWKSRQLTKALWIDAYDPAPGPVFREFYSDGGRLRPYYGDRDNVTKFSVLPSPSNIRALYKWLRAQGANESARHLRTVLYPSYFLQTAD